MKSYWYAALLALALALAPAAGTHGAAAATLTDAEAKAVLEAEHTAQSIFRLPVGTFSVVKKGGRYAGPDAITETRRLEYRAWSRAGLVRIEDDPSWNAFQDGKGDMALYNLQKEGVTTRMKITPTAMAAPFRDKKNPQQYNIPMGNLVIARIEDNVEKNIGADQYRVITFSGKINFLPITAEYFKQYFAKAVSQEGRAIYLIKYEPAAQRWTRLAADWADPSGEFKTKNVQSKLLELSYRKP